MSISDYTAKLEAVVNSFPQHKHVKDEAIVEAHQLELVDVISEIEGIYISGESG